MTDKELIFFLYGVLRALNTKLEINPVIIEMVRKHLYPTAPSEGE